MVNLELYNPVEGRTRRSGDEVERQRREDWGKMWGVGVKMFDFGSQYGEFWCILGSIFYSSATGFTCETV